jgi:hypothetical protein
MPAADEASRENGRRRGSAAPKVPQECLGTSSQQPTQVGQWELQVAQVLRVQSAVQKQGV